MLNYQSSYNLRGVEIINSNFNSTLYLSFSIKILHVLFGFTRDDQC
jgi:hypothetical protein